MMSWAQMWQLLGEFVIFASGPLAEDHYHELRLTGIWLLSNFLKVLYNLYSDRLDLWEFGF